MLLLNAADTRCDHDYNTDTGMFLIERLESQII